MRSGTVALVGRSNVGKSTFLNQVLGEPLAIVSPRPQTTRDNLVGIVHLPDAELAFLDTPGVHRAKNELGRRMNAVALEAARAADVVLIMTDVSRLAARLRSGPLANSPDVEPEDQELLSALGRPAALVVINKTDTLRDKAQLLPLLRAWSEALPEAAVIPGSMLDSDDAARVLRELVLLLPERPGAYADDELTDRPAWFFVREYVREQVLLGTQGEVPHAVAVSIDEMVERGEVLVAKVTLHVDKVGQRKILIGQKGERIRELGTRARLRLQQLLGRRVHLELFVRVSPRWRDSPRQLAELGYDAPPGVGRNEAKAVASRGTHRRVGTRGKVRRD